MDQIWFLELLNEARIPYSWVVDFGDSFGVIIRKEMYTVASYDDIERLRRCFTTL